MAVQEGADRDQGERDGDGLPQLHGVQGQGAGQGPRRRGQQHDPEQSVHLINAKPHLLQEADRAGRLFRQDDPHKQDGQQQPHDVAARQPFQVDQRIGAVVLDDGGGGQQDQGADQGPADPGRLGPPDDAPQPQHGGQQGHPRREQGEGDEVQLFEGLDPLGRRHLQGEDGGQGDQHQPQVEHVDRPPQIMVQQRPDPEPRQGNGQAGQAHADDDALQPVLRREGLDDVEDSERRHARSRDAGDAAHHQGRAEILEEEVGRRRRQEDDQDDLGEQAQAVLHPELDQQQIHAGVGHDEDDRQPGRLGDGHAQVSRQLRNIGRHRRIAQTAGQGHQNPHGGIGPAHRRRVVGRGGRAGQGRPLVRLQRRQILVPGQVPVAAAHRRPPCGRTASSTSSSARRLS